MYIINQSLIYVLGTLVLISTDAVSSSSINTETKKLRGSGNSIAKATVLNSDTMASDATSSTNVRLLKETSKECTLQAVSYMEIPGQTIEGGGTHIHCEIEDDDMPMMHEIQGNDKQMEKLIDKLKEVSEQISKIGRNGKGNWIFFDKNELNKDEQG
mgnify:CR=1 FL=1